MVLAPQGQADGGHRDTSHVLPQGPTPTHTHRLELRHIIISCLFFHCDSRGDQARKDPTHGRARVGAHTDEALQPRGKAPLMELLSPGLPQGQL